MSLPHQQIDRLPPTAGSLHGGLRAVNYFVRRNYLPELSQNNVQSFSPLGSTRSTRLHKVIKVIYDDKEDIGEKLTSVYGAMQSLNTTVCILIIGKPTGVAFYIGTRSEGSGSIPSDVLMKSFEANFPGSELSDGSNSELNDIISRQAFDNICSVTVVPSVREDNEKDFVQGIEKLIDAMQGKEYSALFLATPVPQNVLDARRHGLEQLYATISPYAKTTFAYGENQSDSISEGTSRNFTASVNDGISDTLGTSISVSDNKSRSSTGLIYSDSEGSSVSSSESYSSTTSHGTSQSWGDGTNTGTSFTSGTSKTVTKEFVNKTAENVLTLIDEQLERFKHYDSFGAWEAAAYFCAEPIENCIIAANTFRALVSGEKSNSEYSCVNLWDAGNEHTKEVARYLRRFEHPRFVTKANGFGRSQIVTPGNYISGKELSVFMSLPQKSVSGLSVTTMAEFSRNISRSGDANGESLRLITLGNIHHKGRTEESNPVKLDLNSLTSHCFICGSTGSGKSNTTYHLLQRFIHNKVPFLVVEPAKGEYKTVFGKVKGIHIYGTNPYMGAVLKINPFEFHPSIHVLEHLDRLIEIFNACWEMFAAMPAILKNAIEKAYAQKGWDLQNSVYMKSGAPEFPTFADVLTILPKIIRSSGYSSDTQGDYTGALVTRVESLTNGITGQIFCDNYFVPDSILFDENTIVDLSRVGAAETKSLIMGILVMRLNEYRMATASGSNKKLMHVTVLEEAHNLLKNVSQAQGQQTANPIGKSVEMICNSNAEMRTYGEGFIIVDQSPSSVDIAAIKNTNTKIAMRLPEQHDCEAIGKALSLNEAQIKELSKLSVGVAVVLQSNWLEPVLCKISRAAEERYKEEQRKNTFDQMKRFRGAVLEELMREYEATKTIDLKRLSLVVDAADISASSKFEMMERLASLAQYISTSEALRKFSMSLLCISGLNGVISSSESEIMGHESENKIVSKWNDELLNQTQRMIPFPNAAWYMQLLKYCICAKTFQSGKVNYAMVLRTLYGKR